MKLLKDTRLLKSGASVLAICLWSGSALAAAENAAPESAPKSAFLEEIVVTAMKRSESVKEVPASVTALNSETFERLGAAQLQDFAALVPGLNASSNGAPGRNQIILRGISTGGSSAAVVGIYVDDVPYGSSTTFASGGTTALDLALFDLERVEVLRGPQGTLYGASTMGGLIKYVNKRPNLTEVEGKAEVEFSDTRFGGVNYGGRMAVSAPIVADKFAVRVSGYGSRDGGFIDNVQTGEKDVNSNLIKGGRVSALFQPTETFSLDLGATYQKINTDGNTQIDIDGATGKPVYGSLERANRFNEAFDQKFTLLSGVINWDFGFANLTSITGYNKVHSVQNSDISNTFGFIFGGLDAFLPVETETKKFVEEVRITSSTEGRVEWMIGGFYTKEKSSNKQDIHLYAPGGPELPGSPAFTASLPTDFEEIAGFGNVTFKVTPKFDITAGVRYGSNDQNFTQITTGSLVPAGTTSNTSSDSSWIYLASMRYRFTPDVMAYLRAASGYRAGGPNIISFIPGLPNAFKPDTIWSYEAGVKGSWFDNMLSLDVTGFYIDWTDIQITVSAGGVNARGNGSSATSKGLELSGNLRPIEGLTLSGNLSYTDAYLTDDAPSIGGIKGDALPLVSKWSWALLADYDFPVSDTVRGFVGASYRHMGEIPTVFSQSANAGQFDLNAYDVVDLRAGARIGDIWTLTAYARNLFDVRAPISGQGASGLNPNAPGILVVNQPRTIGLTASINF